VAGVRFVSYTPYGGQFKEVVTDRSKTLKFADVIPDVERFAGAEINFPYHVVMNPEAEIQAICDNYYEDARLNTYEVEVVVPNSLEIRHGDILFLDISPVQEKTSDWSGYYYVAKTIIAYLRSSLSMRVILRRGEMSHYQFKPTGLKDYGVENLVTSPRTAPGIDLNLQAIEATKTTTVVAGVNQTGVVTTTKDPSRG